MKEINVSVENEYPIFITSESSNFQMFIEKFRIDNVFVITDKNVYEIHKDFLDIFKNRLVYTYIIESGEKSKTFDTIKEIYKSLVEKDVNKKTIIVSFGGGVVGDISGFVSSTFMRGLPLIHIPTTLVSQCDSSIGGKTGFDFNNVKNLIGTFYNPMFIYTNVNFLKSLSYEEYINGIAEVIKYGFISNGGLFDYLEENKKEIKERKIDKLIYIVHECAKIKSSIVKQDEFDNGIRHILNFGHTVGHAIESLSNFDLSHGKAVSIGMRVETFISLKCGLIQKGEYIRLINLLEYFGLPIEFKIKDIDEFMRIINKDKKKTEKMLKFALPVDIGRAIITSDISSKIIKEILTQISL